MFTDKKCHLGLIDPSWKAHPIWKDCVICNPILEGGGSHATNLIQSQGRGLLASSSWGVNEYGPTVLLDGNSILNTNRSSEDYDYANVTFIVWASTSSTDVATEWFLYRYVDADNVIRIGKGGNEFTYKSKISGATVWIDVAGLTINDGITHCFGIVSNGTDMRMYCDGVLVGTGGAVASGAFNANDLRIGDYGDGWHGDISAVVIWDRPLGVTEMYEMYRRGPSLGLNEQPFDMPLYGAISAAGSTFNPAWALNSNQIL